MKLRFHDDNDEMNMAQTNITGWWFEPLWKIWKSIGMISNPIYGKIKNGNQTTNQIIFLQKPSPKKKKKNISIPWISPVSLNKDHQLRQLRLQHLAGKT